MEVEGIGRSGVPCGQRRSVRATPDARPCPPPCRICPSGPARVRLGAEPARDPEPAGPAPARIGPRLGTAGTGRQPGPVRADLHPKGRRMRGLYISACLQADGGRSHPARPGGPYVRIPLTGCDAAVPLPGRPRSAAGRKQVGPSADRSGGPIAGRAGNVRACVRPPPESRWRRGAAAPSVGAPAARRLGRWVQERPADGDFRGPAAPDRREAASAPENGCGRSTHRTPVRHRAGLPGSATARRCARRPRRTAVTTEPVRAGGRPVP